MGRIAPTALLAMLAACGAGSPDDTVGPAEDRQGEEPVYAPNVNTYDGVGVGVIDVDPSPEPYIVGPNPPLKGDRR